MTAAPHVPDDARSRWRGGVVLGPGLMAFSGRLGDARSHVHAAVQVLFVARGRLTLHDAHGGAVLAEVAIIPPGVAHEVRAGAEATGFVAYLDPHGVTARAALRRLAGLPGDRAASWVAAARPRPPAQPLDAPRAGRNRGPHPAVGDALTIATGWPGGPPTLVELAARVGISASRLSHVFTAEVGLPYASWRRWTRLQLGLGVVGAGGLRAVPVARRQRRRSRPRRIGRAQDLAARPAAVRDHGVLPR